ncbi:MAG UNVERIFIED_CONTAM: hypothetical protein LVT10_05325 [Anaerolineae bacterium]
MDRIQGWIGVDRYGVCFCLAQSVDLRNIRVVPDVVEFLLRLHRGTNIFLNDRPFVGLDNFKVLLDCADYLNPNTCQEDLFWRSFYNTFGFVIYQVVATVIISLITALALNQKIILRGFFQKCVLLSRFAFARRRGFNLEVDIATSWGAERGFDRLRDRSH